MLCEHCGVEIPEGKLYCPGCGQPLQIVPDFDPGFDDQIELSESDIEGAINGDPEVINPDALLKARTKELEHSEEIAITKRIVPEEPAEEPAEEPKPERKKAVRRASKKKFRVSAGFVIGCAILAVCLIALIIYVVTAGGESYDRHMKRAGAAMDRQNYVAAAEEYIKASEVGDHDPEALCLAAEALILSGDAERALHYLSAVIQADPENPKAYADMIQIYQESGDEEALKRLFRQLPEDREAECLGLARSEEEKKRYEQYLVEPPVFSEPGGTYDHELSLTFSTEKDSDRVFITTDGSIPDENAREVVQDILILDGEYNITAVCISREGYVSAPVQETYVVTAQGPALPKIEPESGEYEEPVNIKASAEEGLEILYSEDGTIPEENARRYVGELPMRFGKSTLLFVTVDENGRRSNPVQVDYDLKFNGAIGQEEAAAFIMSALLNKGVITDAEGHLPEGGQYQFYCKNCYKSGSRLYYIITAAYFNPDGTEDRDKDAFYAMDYKTLDLYKAGRNADGSLTFELLM